MDRRNFLKTTGAAAAGLALAGHMRHFFEERFSPTAIQYTVGATFDGDVQVIHFI